MQNFSMKSDATIKKIQFKVNTDYLHLRYKEMLGKDEGGGLYRNSHFDMHLSINNQQLEDTNTGELIDNVAFSEMNLEIANIKEQFPFNLNITIMSTFEWDSKRSDLETVLGKLIPIKLYEELQTHVSAIIEQAGLEKFTLPPIKEDTFYKKDPQND